MLNYLNAFRVLAEELHFGRAAKRLNITQPALSHQIKMIERAVGCRLLDRSPHYVALTEAGAGFAREVSSALAQIARARDIALDIAGGDAGQLSVGYCELPWSGDLPGLIQRYTARYPAMDISLKALPTNEQAEHLRSGSLDVAFLHPPIDETGLVMRPAGRERIFAAFAKGYEAGRCDRVTLPQLERERLIFCSELSAPHLHGVVMSAFAKAGITPRLTISQDSWHAMAAAAIAGLGVALLPQSLSRNFSSDLVFKPLTGLDYELETAIVVKAKPWRPAVARFMEIVEEPAQDSSVAQPVVTSTRRRA